MNEGYLYIITNSSYEGYVKIGITENIDKRLSTYQTADPHRKYKIVFFFKTS